MKKILFLFVTLVGLTTTVYAQSQIATLSHDGELSSFYGATALKDAHAQAAAGDVITLSAGFFDAVDISKSITLRGAGMGIAPNDSTVYDPTVIQGQFSISVSDSTRTFIMEGIVNEDKVTLNYNHNAQFVKCNFKKVIIGSTEQNISFLQCYVAESIDCRSGKSAGGSTINGLQTITSIASYFKGADFYYARRAYFTNCVVESFFASSGNITQCYPLYRSYITNSIIINTNTEGGTLGSIDYPANRTTYSLWVGASSSSNPFGVNSEVDRHNSIFAGPKAGLFEEDSFCVLSEEAKKYLGNDGTELGIYGGSLPFDPTPSNPQITKFKVAPKTTADGNLSVEIEVKQPN